MKSWYKSGDALLSEISSSRAAPGEVILWFLGQSGFVIKLLDTIIYVDAMLHEWETSEPDTRRLFDPPFTPCVDADIFACTHDHSDHFNVKNILPQARNHKTRFLVPAALSNKLLETGIQEDRILSAVPNTPIKFGEITIQSIVAEHCDNALGYIFCTGGLSVYHAGDTFVTEKLIRELRDVTLSGIAPVNIALLPVNGTDWERTARGIVGNMNCEDAAKLARSLNFDLTIPAHFDFVSGNTVNPAHITDVFSSICPDKKMHILALGERFIYRK